MAKDPMRDWLNELFLIRQPKPNRVILIISVIVAIALDVSLMVCKRIDADFFLNRCGLLLDVFIRYAATLGSGLGLFFLLCGIYKFFIRHFGKKL